MSRKKLIFSNLPETGNEKRTKSMCNTQKNGRKKLIFLPLELISKCVKSLLFFRETVHNIILFESVKIEEQF